MDGIIKQIKLLLVFVGFLFLVNCSGNKEVKTKFYALDSPRDNESYGALKLANFPLKDSSGNNAWLTEVNKKANFSLDSGAFFTMNFDTSVSPSNLLQDSHSIVNFDTSKMHLGNFDTTNNSFFLPKSNIEAAKNWLVNDTNDGDIWERKIDKLTVSDSLQKLTTNESIEFKVENEITAQVTKLDSNFLEIDSLIVVNSDRDNILVQSDSLLHANKTMDSVNPAKSTELLNDSLYSSDTLISAQDTIQSYSDSTLIVDDSLVATLDSVRTEENTLLESNNILKNEAIELSDSLKIIVENPEASSTIAETSQEEIIHDLDNNMGIGEDKKSTSKIENEDSEKQESGKKETILQEEKKSESNYNSGVENRYLELIVLQKKDKQSRFTIDSLQRELAEWKEIGKESKKQSTEMDKVTVSDPIILTKTDTVIKTEISKIMPVKLLVDSLNIFFGMNQSVLTSENKTQVNKWINKHVLSDNWVIEIAGFADAVGNQEYNKILSQKRANITFLYLNTKETSATYRVVSYGEEMKGFNSVSMPTNRRVLLKLYSVE